MISAFGVVHDTEISKGAKNRRYGNPAKQAAYERLQAGEGSIDDLAGPKGVHSSSKVDDVKAAGKKLKGAKAAKIAAAGLGVAAAAGAGAKYASSKGSKAKSFSSKVSSKIKENPGKVAAIGGGTAGVGGLAYAGKKYKDR